MTGGKDTDSGLSRGSALILTVLLTSILAIVGVLFLLASRVETLSTSSLVDERDLNLAVDTIISKLSNELVLDTPGVAGQEYYDYPGDRDTWLASIEPCNDVGTYRWGQISDLTGYVRLRYNDPYNKYDNDWGKGPPSSGGAQTDVVVDPKGYDETGGNLPGYPVIRQVIPEYHEIALDPYGELYEQWADADGDGIADSKWIELDDVMGSKGQKVYAAVRVIDNCGLLNANTAYEFDANSTNILRVDGSRLHQINLDTLARNLDNANGIFFERANDKSGMAPSDTDLDDYERDGAWRLVEPSEDYTPFDISDELELRHRYLVSSPAIVRMENTWEDTLPYNDEVGLGTGYDYVADRPYDARNTTWNLDDAWQKRVTDPCDTEYDRRHLLTAYSIDRIIAADANEIAALSGMININFDPCDYPGDPNRRQLDERSDDYGELYSWRTARDFYIRCSRLMDPNLERTTRIRMKKELAQLAVNLVDLRDRDTDVTSLRLGDPNIGGGIDFAANDYVYGLEPHPVITQVAIRIDPCDPNSNPNYYAVELFNPFAFDVNTRPEDYSLLVTDFNQSFDPCDPNTFGASLVAEIPLPVTILLPDQYMVVYNVPNATVVFGILPTIEVNSPGLALSTGYVVIVDPNLGPPAVDANFVNPRNLVVKRRVQARYDEASAAESRYIFVDRQLIFRDWVRWDANGLNRFYGRDFDIEAADWWDVLYPRAVEAIDVPYIPGQLDHPNDLPSPRPLIDISVPYGPDRDLRTVGDIARIWTIGPTDRLYDPCDAEDPNSSELFNPRALNIINFDPNDPNDVNDPNNTRFAGFVEYARTVGEKLLFSSISKAAGFDQDEDFIRLNLADPLYTTLFNYITVFDPRVDGIDNDGDGGGRGRSIDPDELKIPGRINVNTAPYFVIAQLPWMTDAIAGAIVDYRDMRGDYDYSVLRRSDRLEEELGSQLGYQIWRNYMRDDLDERSFASIGELNLVANHPPDAASIWKYALEAGPSLPPHFPDLTTPYGRDDKTDNDFEERDLIFARISNLATVRSDVFTAYVLVRLGADGPQKRVMAILDRSDVYSNTDRVKVPAVHDVSYPK